jgi:N-acylneuraminate cytidylyltransferase
MACFPFDHCNPWWAFRFVDSGAADYVLDSPWDSRSQDRERLYCPTGALGIARSGVFKVDPVGVMKRCRFVPIPWESGFDIDSESDFVTAEALISIRKRNDA